MKYNKSIPKKGQVMGQRLYRPDHSPSYEGEVVKNLYCPVGWCTKRHAKATAKMLTPSSWTGLKTPVLCWVFEGACTKKISKRLTG